VLIRTRMERLLARLDWVFPALVALLIGKAKGARSRGRLLPGGEDDQKLERNKVILSPFICFTSLCSRGLKYFQRLWSRLQITFGNRSQDLIISIDILKYRVYSAHVFGNLGKVFRGNSSTRRLLDSGCREVL
jgi:hypothetical protein